MDNGTPQGRVISPLLFSIMINTVYSPVRTDIGRSLFADDGDLFHSATRALVRSGTDVGRLGLARSRRSNSSQNCSMGLRSELCAGQPSFSILISTNHGDLRLVCGCSAMETHFMKLPTNSYCVDVASRGSLALGSECCKQGQTIFTRYVLQHLAVPFCELVWPLFISSWLCRCCS